MRIAYGKIGRSWKLDPTNGTSTGGDADVARALHLLARLRPNDEFILVGRNSGENPQDVGYPENVINPWTPEFTKKMKSRVAELNPKTAERKGLFTPETMAAVLSYFETELTPELFDGVDEVIMWAGQHGTSNMILPQIDDRTQNTKPQDSFIQYASYLLMGINQFRDRHPEKDTIWLCPDPRNYLKLRDLKHPLSEPVLAQYVQSRKLKHERYGDETEPPHGISWGELGGLWVAPQSYIYSALELTALPTPAQAEVSTDFENRHDFGMLVNENRAYVSLDRNSIVKSWVLSSWPDAEIFGKWSKKSMEELGRMDIRPAPYEHVPTVLKRWRCTITTPASGSGWATAKPWECFAYGVVCFFHPGYDVQGHILPTLDQLSESDMYEAFNPEGAALAKWLRVDSPEDLKRRVDYLTENPEAWKQLILAQRAYFDSQYQAYLGGVRMIMERLDG